MDIHDAIRHAGGGALDAETVKQAFRPVRYAADDVVFREGARSEALYFIRSGQALVTRKGGDGGEVPVNVLSPGAFFGEIGLIEDMPRTATVRALGPLEAHKVEEDDFRRLMAESPAFSAFLKEVGRSRMLGHTAIFKGLDPEDLAAVQNLFEERNLAENEVIFEEGEVSEGLYVILRGTVRIAKRARSGQDLTLAYLGPGDLLGEQGLIDSQPRSATAVTTEPTKLLALPREDFLRLLRERPVVSFNMLRILSQRLRETSREAATAKGTSFFRGITIIARPGRCLSCRACEMACAVSKSRTRDLFEAIQEEPLPVRRIHVRRTNKGAEPIVRPEHCVHCREAPCLVKCKLHAIRRDAFSGTIVIDEKACKGCGLCARACPFRVIAMIPGQGKRRMALKCTHCAEDQAGPACVRSCPTHALVISLSSMATV